MSAKLPASTEILIVGAGPTGLACANSLLKNGIKNVNVMIVDARPEGVKNLSRAIVVHARTTEELDKIECAELLVERGHRTQYVALQTGLKKPLFKADFGCLVEHRARFPFPLVISQSDTEEILEESLNGLGVTVFRSFQVTGLERTDGGINVSFQTGEIVKAKFVVGADGIRSMVRELVHISFIDPSTNQNIHDEITKRKDLQMSKSGDDLLVIADVYFSEDLPTGHGVNAVFGPMGFVAVIQMPPAKGDVTERPIYRIIYPPKEEGKEDTMDYLQKILSEGLGLPKEYAPIVAEVIYSSQFRSHCAAADEFYRPFGDGHVLLIGDAAHVHSPFCGQGMNLGIREAIQLGRIVSSVVSSEKSASGATPGTIKGSAQQTLASFSSERRKLALKVISMTSLISWMAGLKSAPARIIRNTVLRIINHIPFIKNKIILRLSGFE